MKIGYDASPIRRQVSGVGHYASSLLEALLARYPDCQFLLLSHLAPYGLRNASLIPTQKRGFALKEIWMQLWLPHILKRHQPDVCHFTNSIAPLRMRMPYVVTVHDLGLMKHPEWHPRTRRIWMRRIIRPSLMRASQILCDSRITRKGILEWLHVCESRVRVVPLAARKAFFAVHSEADRAAVRARYGLVRPFVLYVGNIEPRKNLPTLLDAFSSLNPPGIDLVLAGRRAWLWKNTMRAALPLMRRGSLHFLDYVSEENLPALYQSALAFAYPSLLEGFGLPVLEAMASGVPVLASGIDPLIQLVGDAGWIVAPDKTEEWREALAEAIGDKAKRDRFTACAREVAKLYSWDRAAQQTMECYEEALRLSPAQVGDRAPGHRSLIPAAKATVKSSCHTL